MTVSAPLLAPVGHEEFVADVRALADQLQADWRPDWLIGVGRGGLVPGAYLSHATGIALLSVDHSSQDFGFADELLHKLARKTRDGERLLIIDDINDSGGTIAYLRDALVRFGGVPDHVRVAVLINNIRSTAMADYWSRSIDRSTDKSWFVFPWEAMAPTSAIVADAGTAPERLA